jgi:glycosidase
MNKEIPDDPKTWVWTQADRLAIKLIEEAHRRKIRIIFDGPFNHVGLDCFAFQDLLKNQEKSRFVNWVTIYEWPNPEKKTPIWWQDWMGEKIYATLRKDQKEPNDYIMASTKRWMKPEIDGETHDGIDGWRLDCADFIPHEFWRDWCKFVRTVNPQAYIMGEVVKPFAPYQSYLNSEEFCSVMNYPFKSLIEKYFINKSINASDFDRKLSLARNSVPKDVNYVMYNLLDSHDTERIASLIVNPGIQKSGDARDFGNQVLNGFTGGFNTRKPTEKEYDILKLITIFQMTYIGAPGFYYGDEVGMWGPARSFKPMVWDDLQYENERYIPDSSVKGPGNRLAKDDKVEINQDLFRHFQKLIKIRNNNPALRLGDFRTVLTDDHRELIVFSRTYQNETVIVAINNGETAQTVKIETTATYRDLLNEDKPIQAKDGQISVDVPAKWGAILKKGSL